MADPAIAVFQQCRNEIIGREEFVTAPALKQLLIAQVVALRHVSPVGHDHHFETLGPLAAQSIYDGHKGQIDKQHGVMGMIDDTFAAYDIVGLQAAITLAQEQLADLEAEMVDVEEIEGAISSLDQRVEDVELDLSNLPDPIYCEWSQPEKRVVNGENGCSDDLEIYCRNHKIYKVRMKCVND